MTGEVRLVEEEALNLPGAAAMAAAGSVERGPSMVDQWGPYARSLSGLHRLLEVRFFWGRLPSHWISVGGDPDFVIMVLAGKYHWPRYHPQRQS